ncbi:MAG: hypothetical protein J2P57_02605 [Acidimicrobiaceae bacterium]|nr:hypothetical protein [Acidimicrobiaceae bacterium]
MYRIVSVDGQDAAEKVLNETVRPDVELVHTHVASVQGDRSGAQENVMLGVPLTRFTFIFRSRA